MSQTGRVTRLLDVTPTEHIFRTRFLPLYPKLYSLAGAILGMAGDEAADAVQEAMVKIWNLGDRMADIEYPVRYAFSVTRTTAIDMLRRRVETLPGPTPDIEADPLPDPDTRVFLDRMISSLPPVQQMVMRLNVCDDLSTDEIADRTGLTEANVRQLLSRGRKKLRVLYSKYMKS